MDYNLSGLSNRTFEQLIQALALKILGPGVSIFGDGPDGGREATFEGTFRYPLSGNRWSGYGVIQVKFRQKPTNSKNDGTWAIDQLRSEIAKYQKPSTTYRKPDYFIFVTNVALTAVKDKGSLDGVNAILDEFQDQLPLSGRDVWDYNKICSFLDGNDEIRRTYSPWIITGDILSHMFHQLQSDTPNLDQTLSLYLSKELLVDEFVNLEQAGHDINEKIPLAQVFVDLSVFDESQELANQNQYTLSETGHQNHEVGFIKSMLEVSSHRLDPITTNRDLPVNTTPDRRDPQPRVGRYVLIGGPGQGKTTVGQFICQIYRSSIITRRPPESVDADTLRAIDLIRQHCKNEGIDWPSVPRFPFRIVLDDFASALASDTLPHINSVLSYLRHRILKRTDDNITANTLRTWFQHYPCVVIFDGLDEVPSSSNREEVLQSIREFWVDATDLQADILAIATTRPQGYNQDFARSNYRHMSLAPLSKDMGLHFAKRLVNVRYGSDTERKTKVLQRLERALDNEATSRLMRSPLQVTIMSALVDRMGQPPEERWRLFNKYYDVIYQREVERNIPASEILSRHGPTIAAIHSRVGLLLQIDSELDGRTESRFSRERFETLVQQRLIEEGHKGDDLNHLTLQIVDAASQRLVFLVGLESDRVGFEIRSLQEFMAAECLMDHCDNIVRDRLREIAPHPNWRNTFLFAAGKCFDQRQYLRETIHDICGTLNEMADDPVAATVLTGSNLAIDLLEDGLARYQPIFAAKFARIAIRGLDLPDHTVQVRLAHVYEPELSAIYQEEIDRRIHSPKQEVRFATWRCLLLLSHRNIDWAKTKTIDEWPDDREQQTAILEHCNGFWRNRWAAEQFMNIVGCTPFERAQRLYHTGTTETSVHSEPQQRVPSSALPTFQPSGLDEAMLNLLDWNDRKLHTATQILGHNVGSFVRIRPAEDDLHWFYRLSELSTKGATWTVYKWAAFFAKDPSKDTLAYALKQLANDANLQFEGPESKSNLTLSYLTLPWPFYGCLKEARDVGDLIAIADRSAKGELGDVEEWIGAEDRWIRDGVTMEDFVGISETVMPFDKNIRNLGYPMNLHLWPMFRSSIEWPSLLEMMLTLYDNISNDATREFVRDAIESVLLPISVLTASQKLRFPTSVNFENLQKIYKELPSGSNIPLGLVLELIASSQTGFTEILRFFDERETRYLVYPFRVIFNEDGVDKLVQAFQNPDDHRTVLSIIADMAEAGRLPSGAIVKPAPVAIEDVNQRRDALIVLLAQETWESDRSVEFIRLFEMCCDDESFDDFRRRVFDTLNENRSNGPFYEQFLTKFGETFKKDSVQDQTMYNTTLENALRRRKSGFTDPATIGGFQFPSGITDSI